VASDQLSVASKNRSPAARRGFLDISMSYTDAEIEPALDAFEHCISRYAVGLAFESSGPHLDTASATAILWRGRKLLVTARHVFPEGSESAGVTLLLPSSRPLSRGKKVEVFPPLEPNCIVQLRNVALVRCDSREALDLAYFEVDDTIWPNSDLQFYDLPSIAHAPPSGAGCILSGFPADVSDLIAEREWIAKLINRRSKICTPDDSDRFLKGYDSSSHFLMRFRKADIGVRAEGFSGGGVWFLLKQPPNSNIWRPIPGLAGIQSMWFPKKKITLSIRVDHLVQFLDNSVR
jgi:hypothetical protein